MGRHCKIVDDEVKKSEMNEHPGQGEEGRCIQNDT